MMNKDSQNDTKERFEWLFQNERHYYEKQTKQDKEILKIIKALNIKDEQTVVDLGTGTGYIAFKIAKMFPSTLVIGTDIVEETLKNNKLLADKEGISNIDFKLTDGVVLPFEDNSVDCIVTRFALHHFTMIKQSFKEFSRVLKQGGMLFISDPTPNEEDRNKFIDRFMQIVKDGHVTFYRKSELDSIANNSGFIIKDYYYSKIRFPSKSRTKEYMRI